MRRILRVPIAILLTALVAACQLGSPPTRPVPSVPQIGADLKCAAEDHAFEDTQVGWGFCYPGTWRYVERAQSSTNPPGLDLTFDISDVPCPIPSPLPNGDQPQPECCPDSCTYAFMIVSTYARGDAASLDDWMKGNLNPVPSGSPIVWGDAVEALKLTDGRRIALTPHNVVLLQLRSGNLDLEGAMSSRLDTWKFLF